MDRLGARTNFESSVVAACAFAFAGALVFPIRSIARHVFHDETACQGAWPEFTVIATSFLGSLLLWRRFVPRKLAATRLKAVHGSIAGVAIAVACHFLAPLPGALLSLVTGPFGVVVTFHLAAQMFAELWIVEVVLGAIAGACAAFITNRPSRRRRGVATDDDVEDLLAWHRRTKSQD